MNAPNQTINVTIWTIYINQLFISEFWVEFGLTNGNCPATRSVEEVYKQSLKEKQKQTVEAQPKTSEEKETDVLILSNLQNLQQKTRIFVT